MTTLKELAALLNISVSTVSKALNNSHEISDKTRERVKELAAELNYKPNIKLPSDPIPKIKL